MKYLSIPVAICSFAALVACGGGNSGTTFPSIPAPNSTPTPFPLPGITFSPSPSNTSAPTASPTTAATASPNPGTTSGTARTTLMSITIPHRAANSQVTLPSSPTKIVAIINKLNGSSTLPGGTQPRTQVDLSNTSAATCTSPGPCTFTMPAPAGSLNVTVTVYSGANALATDVFTYTSTGAAGQTQSDTLKAVVANVTLPPINVQFGQSSTNELVLTAQDPSGATIADGTYANNVNLSISGGSSTTGLQLIGSSTGPQSSVILNAPSDRVQLVYDGGAIPTGIQYTTASYAAALSLAR